MSSVLTKWRQLYQSLGIGWAIVYLLHRVLAKIGVHLYAYRFAYQPITQRRLTTKPEHIRFIWLSEYCPEILIEDRKEAILRARFERQDKCLAAFQNEQLIGFAWFAMNTYPEDECRCLYRFNSPPLIWDYDVYIAPKFRLTRLFAQLWEEANQWAFSESYRWSVSRISAFNAPSLRAHQRFGAQLKNGSVFICIGQWQLLIANCAPYIHMSLSKEPSFHFFPPEKANLSDNASH